MSASSSAASKVAWRVAMSTAKSAALSRSRESSICSVLPSALKSSIRVASVSPIGTLVNGVQFPSPRRSKYSDVPSVAMRELNRS